MHNPFTARSRKLSGDIFYTRGKRRSPWLTSLVAHWKLNEPSGIRADSHGGNDLADFNTVTSAAGKIGSAASFAGINEESLGAADNSALSMGDIDFSLALWVWFDTLDFTGLTGKWSTDSTEYIAYFDGTNLRFHVSDDGVNNNSVVNSQAIAINTWYLFVAWHDATANTINLSVNNGATASTAHSTGVYDGDSALYFGRNEEGLSYFSGRLDSASIWKRLLTSTERTQLYNSGSGLDYPFS